MTNDNFHTVEILEQNVTRYIPKELAHCTPSEFKDVVRLLYDWQTGIIDYHDFRVQAIFLLLNLKTGKRKINALELDAMHANMFEISKLMDSFFDIDGKNYQIKLNLIANPIPYIRPILVNIKGPETRFANTVFGQYEDAVNLFQMYHRSNDTTCLYQIMAIYYQEPKHYNSEKTENRAAYFKKTIDFAKVYGFYLYFKAFQEYVTSSKVIWEGQIIDLSILFSSSGDTGSKSDIPGLGTKAIAFLLAESNVFGSLKELRKEKLWEILLRLYDIRKRDLDNKAEEKRLNSTTNA